MSSGGPGRLNGMSALLHHEALAVDDLVDRLRTLTAEDIRRAGLLIRSEARSAADEIEWWWSATVRVGHALRHQHRRLPAAQATAAATRAVRHAAHQAGLAADDPDVVATARAATDAAAAVVATPSTDPEATYFLTRLGLGATAHPTSTPAAA
jgi:hypothetical protein